MNTTSATIDRYGDISFLIDDGHVRLDIGVSGTGEISFFVEDPETGPDLLGDEPFEDHQVPKGLRKRMSAIQTRRRHSL